MAFAQSPKAKRSVEEEQRRDRAAHREIVRLNRARGVAANLEDALRLHRGGDFRTLTDLGILGSAPPGAPRTSRIWSTSKPGSTVAVGRFRPVGEQE